MENWKTSPKQNCCAFLGPITADKGRIFQGVIDFLKRSRIHYAISKQHAAFKDILLEFYRNAKVDPKADPIVITSSVQGKEVIITEQILREVLQFGDSEADPIVFDAILIRGGFLRMKYLGRVDKQTMLKKGLLPPEFKYLTHVVLKCLGPRKGTFDAIRDTLASAIVALTLNKPFNFSKMILHHLKEIVLMKPTKKSFIVYHRFLQLIIDSQIPDLVKHPAEYIVT